MGSAWSNPGPARQLVVGQIPNPQIVIDTVPSTNTGEIRFKYNASDNKLSDAVISNEVLNEGSSAEIGRFIISTGQYGNPLQNLFAELFSDVSNDSIAISLDTPNTSLGLNELIAPFKGIITFEAQDPTLFGNNIQEIITSNPGGPYTWEVDAFDGSKNWSFHFSSTTGLALGSGRPGMTYEEEVTITPVTIATSVVNMTQIVALGATSVKINDYGGSGFNLTNGVWTAPDDGFYIFSFAVRWGAWIAGSSMALNMVINGTLRTSAFAYYDSGSQQEPAASLTALRFVGKGQTVTFNCRQNTGVNQTIATANGSQILVKKVPL